MDRTIVQPMRKWPGIEIRTGMLESVIIEATFEAFSQYAEEYNLDSPNFPSEEYPAKRLTRIVLNRGGRLHCSANLDILEASRYGLFLKGGNPRDLKQYRNNLLPFLESSLRN